MRIKVLVGLFACLVLAGLSVGALGAAAYRAPLVQEGSGKEEAWLARTELTNLPEGQIEGACGVAVAQTVYVADYYHQTIDFFSPAGVFQGSESLFAKQE